MGEHVGRDDHSVLIEHDHVKLHYALYHAGDFSSSTSGTRNEQTGSWVDDGVIRLPNKRSFGYTRLDRYPDELKIDGTVEQHSLEVPLPVARNPIALGEMIQRHSAEATAVAIPSPERTPAGAMKPYFNFANFLRTIADCLASRICQQARPLPTRSHSSNCQTTFLSLVISKICGFFSPA